MIVEFLKATKEDYDELVNFANYVFSNSSEKTDFPSLLPKLYKKEYYTMNNHYIVKEDGKIKAVVGVFPMELMVLNRRLKVAGIGTVSVHPNSRGSGYMKKLMNMALDEIKNNSFDFSCLGGMKQRYEYFSYTPCGQEVHFTINNENVKHKLNSYINDKIIFREILENEMEFLDKAYDLYNNGNYKFKREKFIFLDVLRSWSFRIYSIESNNNFLGYMVVTQDKKYVSELVVNNDELYLTVIANYINYNKLEEINIELPLWEKKRIREFFDIAESSTINSSYQFNIINYEETLEILLNFKNSYSKLEEGRISIDIREYGKFEIVVNSEGVSVNAFNGKCDIELDHLKAMQFLFSPLSSFILENEKINNIINSWFPIPLFISTQDKV
ncbi:MAG: GNAT family N-acetyltransferase [Clostridium celatum]|nr:GNAT family N-acetyltransferase [Clostridium celatum]